MVREKKKEREARLFVVNELRKLAAAIADRSEALLQYEVKHHMRKVSRNGAPWRMEPTGGRTVTLVVGDFDRDIQYQYWDPPSIADRESESRG